MAEHEFEPELSQPVPRPTRRRGGLAVGCGFWFVRLFLLPHTIAGIFILGLAVTGTLGYLGVLMFGVEMEGRVVRREESQSRKSKKTTYTLHYVYTVEGQEYAAGTTVTAEAYAAHKEGQAIPLRVLPWSPLAHWVRLPGASPGASVLAMWFGAVFWNGIMSIFLYMVWVRPWLQWRLVRWGELTSGIVRDVRSTPQKGGGLSYTIRYEYASSPTLNEPEQLYTRSASSNSTAAATVKVGDVVTVLYDPKRPKRSVPYLFADFEVKMS